MRLTPYLDTATATDVPMSCVSVISAPGAREGVLALLHLDFVIGHA